MDRNLYPLKFTPILKEKIWGGKNLQTILNKNCNGKSSIGESWEISGVESDISVVENGFLQGNSLNELIEIYMGDLVGDSVYEKFGLEFPLLIKFIDAQDDLSVQVHPDDEVAKKKHHSYGKTEMWYVVDAENGAKLINGFKRSVDKEEYISALESGKLTSILNYEPVKSGDVFFIPSGRIHAINKGIVVAEIQQTSDITYRIYDWDRLDDNGNGRELHTELALDVINFKAEKSYRTDYKTKANDTINLVDCSYFTTNIISINGLLSKDYNSIDSFVIYMCIEGKFSIKTDQNYNYDVSKGETILIPATIKSLDLISEKQSKILEIYIRNKSN